MIYVGLEVGAVIDQEGWILHNSYGRHFSEARKNMIETILAAVSKFSGKRCTLAVAGSGGIAAAKLLGADFIQEVVAGASMDSAQGVLLTGGGDVMMRDEEGLDGVREMDRGRNFWEAALFKSALERRKPILGICRGLQLMNVVLGGNLWDDIPT